MTSTWLPIATAPRDGAVIDLWDRGGYRVCNASWDYHYWMNGEPDGPKSWGRSSDGPAPDPTHWMPVPEGPL